MDIFPMIELILLCAAAISIAVTASVQNKRRFAPVPARTLKRHPQFRLGERPIAAAPSPARVKSGVLCLAHLPMNKAGARRSWDMIEQGGRARSPGFIA